MMKKEREEKIREMRWERNVKVLELMDLRIEKLENEIEELKEKMDVVKDES